MEKRHQKIQTLDCSHTQKIRFRETRNQLIIECGYGKICFLQLHEGLRKTFVERIRKENTSIRMGFIGELNDNHETNYINCVLVNLLFHSLICFSHNKSTVV